MYLQRYSVLDNGIRLNSILQAHANLYHPLNQKSRKPYQVYQSSARTLSLPTANLQSVPLAATAFFPNTLTRSSSGLKVFAPPRGPPYGVPKTSCARILQLGSMPHSAKVSGLKLGW